MIPYSLPGHLRSTSSDEPLLVVLQDSNSQTGIMTGDQIGNGSAVISQPMQNSPNNQADKLSFFSHPLFLLFAGFVFTSACGGGLTFFWQKQEWSRQQKNLYLQKKLEQQFLSIQAFQKSAFQSISVFDDVNSFFERTDDLPDNEKKLEALELKFRESSNSWRSEYPNLKLQVEMYFPELEGTLQQIYNRRKMIAVSLNNLIEEFNENKKTEEGKKKNKTFNKDHVKEHKKILTMINDIKDFISNDLASKVKPKLIENEKKAFE